MIDSKAAYRRYIRGYAGFRSLYISSSAANEQFDDLAYRSGSAISATTEKSRILGELPGVLMKPWRYLLRWRFQKLSTLLGFSIPLNVCGPGLAILHYGSIVISRHARIDARCTLNSCVNIGVKPGAAEGPSIGNDVYVGPGVKVWNSIHITDGCVFGAKACVSKDLLVSGSVIVGVNRTIRKRK